jgi:hypothetical protein
MEIATASRNWFPVKIGPHYLVRFLDNAVWETTDEWRVRYLMMGLSG